MSKKLPALDIEGPPLTDTKHWQLKVDGLVEHPKTFSIDEIKAFKPVEPTEPFVCVEGWDMWVKWKGVELKKIIDHVKPLPGACWVTFYSYSEYTDSLFMKDAMDKQDDTGIWLRGRRPAAGEWRAVAAGHSEQARLQVGQVAYPHQLSRMKKSAGTGK